jgi:hypothetical protein
VSDPSLIFRLREMSAEDLVAADEKYYRGLGYPEVIARDTDGVFDFFTVLSGDHEYTVIRLGTFVSCECKDFEFKGPCKHIAASIPNVCRQCLEAEVPQGRIGSICDSCKREAAHREMDNAPYLKPTSSFRPESLGGVRF